MHFRKNSIYIVLIVVILALSSCLAEERAANKNENSSPVISNIFVDPLPVLVGTNADIRVFASDPDKDELSYKYEVNDGTIAGEGNTAVFTAPLEINDSITLKITVTDSSNNSTNAQMNLISSNNPPYINQITLSDQVAQWGKPVTISVIAGDSDNDALTYEYAIVSGSGSLEASTSDSVIYTCGQADELVTISVTVKDLHADGTSEKGSSATSEISFITKNNAPSIESISVSNTEPNWNETVNINVIASDPNGDTLQYSYEVISGNLSGLTGGINPSQPSSAVGANEIQYTASATNEPVIIEAIVEDLDIDSLVKTTVKKRISFETINTTPVISQLSVSSLRPNWGDPVTIFVTASDADGDNLKYSYSIDAALSSKFAANNTEVADSITDAGNGVAASAIINSSTSANEIVTVTVTVEDLQGAGPTTKGTSATASVTFTVDNPDKVPPFTPQMGLPLNNYVTLDMNPTFTFSGIDLGPNGGVSQFYIQISSDSFFNNIVDAAYVPAIADAGTYSGWTAVAAGDYYWRIMSFDASGNPSPLSTSRKISVGQSAGDMDGDNLADFVVADPNSDNVYLYSGFTLQATFTENFTNNLVFGTSLDYGCDINKDNFSDLVVGSPDPTNNQGNSHFYFGGNPMDTTFDAYTSRERNNYNGDSINCHGDYNGDGYSDVVIGEPTDNPYNANRDGSVQIFRGRFFFDVTANIGDDLRIDALEIDQLFGTSVAFIDDMNNDGLSELVVGAPYSIANANKVGMAVVYSGSDIKNYADNGWNNPPPMAVIYGETIDDEFGKVVASAGDINGDGVGDFMVSAPSGDGNAGADSGLVYIFYGGPTITSSAANADIIIEGNAGGDQIGNSLARCPNVTGQNTNEILIGAANINEAYLLKDGFFSGDIATLMANPSPLAVKFINGVSLGDSVACAGNIDGNLRNFNSIILGDAGNQSVYIYIGGDGQNFTTDGSGIDGNIDFTTAGATAIDITDIVTPSDPDQTISQGATNFGQVSAGY